MYILCIHYVGETLALAHVRQNGGREPGDGRGNGRCEGGVTMHALRPESFPRSVLTEELEEEELEAVQP